MEIFYAWTKHIPVYVIDPSGKFASDVWLEYHTMRSFTEIDECFEYIVDSIQGEEKGAA